MSTQGGFGVALKITISSTLTIVSNLLDVDFPPQMKYLDESTGHDSTTGYYEAVDTGKKRLEPFPATLAWDDTLATHTEILAAFASTTPYAMTIADPGGQETIAFNAHVERISRIARQEETYKADVLFHPTASPTIT